MITSGAVFKIIQTPLTVTYHFSPARQTFLDFGEVIPYCQVIRLVPFGIKSKQSIWQCKAGVLKLNATDTLIACS